MKRIGIILAIAFMATSCYGNDTRTMDELVEHLSRYHTVERTPMAFLDSEGLRTLTVDELVISLVRAPDGTSISDLPATFIPDSVHMFTNGRFLLTVNCFDWYMEAAKNNPMNELWGFSEEILQQSLEMTREINYVMMNPATRERVAETFMRF